MSDIKSQSGKLIYELTSADALKDTDLIPISENYLTRSISLSQLKLYNNSGMYTSQKIDELIDTLRDDIKGTDDSIFTLQNNINEFRNEFITRLSNLNNELESKINDIDQKLIDEGTQIRVIIRNTKNELNQSITDLNTSLTNVNNALTTKITNLETKVDEQILIGNAVPTTLKEGQIYLQYF